jgi:uncharacterized protein RhaS with RHS repeats
MWLPEALLYHYKARVYSPNLGRFLQADPIGYADGLNLYAYVGGDPVNGIDPSGLFCRASRLSTCAQQNSPRRTDASGDNSSERGSRYRIGQNTLECIEPVQSEICVRATRSTFDFGELNRLGINAFFNDARILGGASGNRGEGGGRGSDGGNSGQPCSFLQKAAGTFATALETGSNALNGLSDLAYFAALTGSTPALGAGAGLDGVSIALDALSYALDLAAGNDISNRLAVSAVKIIPGSTAVRVAIRSSELNGRIADGLIDVLAPSNERECTF